MAFRRPPLPSQPVSSPSSGNEAAKLFGPRPVPPHLSVGDEEEEEMVSPRDRRRFQFPAPDAVADDAVSAPRADEQVHSPVLSPLKPAFRLSVASMASPVPLKRASTIDLPAYYRDGFQKAYQDSPVRLPKAETPPEKDLAANEETEETAMWRFWERFMQEHDTMLQQEKVAVNSWVTKGLPPALRGLIWQLVASAKDVDMEAKYLELRALESPFEKIILRDLPRTFPQQPLFREEGGAGQQKLLHVTRAYSLFDPDVGYCQGLSFLAGILLLQMPEEEAFSMLVQWMHQYDLREHYTPKMDLLQARLYMWDRLLAEYCPLVSSHLAVEGIRSSMYASQWFLTLFAYRFPLETVLRILDLFMFEGVDVLFRVGLVLMQRAEAQMIRLDFEELLEFVKNGIHAAFEDGSATDVLIQEMMDLKLSRKKLDRFMKDYRQLEDASSRTHFPSFAESHPAPNEAQEEGAKSEEVEKVWLQRQLDQAQATILRQTLELKRLENTLTALNREHVELANDMLKVQMTKEGPLFASPEKRASPVQSDETGEHERILRRASLIAKSPHNHRSRDHLVVTTTTTTTSEHDAHKWRQMEDALQAREEALVHCKVQLAQSVTEVDQVRQQYREALREIEVLKGLSPTTEQVSSEKSGDAGKMWFQSWRNDRRPSTEPSS